VDILGEVHHVDQDSCSGRERYAKKVWNLHWLQLNAQEVYDAECPSFHLSVIYIVQV
jgi:hypothetical protein